MTGVYDMGPTIALGAVFGRLTVIDIVEIDTGGTPGWLYRCRCTCGARVGWRGSPLRQRKSCGHCSGPTRADNVARPLKRTPRKPRPVRRCMISGCGQPVPKERRSGSGGATCSAACGLKRKRQYLRTWRAAKAATP